MARHDISSILGITFDVAVIGGGVMGTAVARDAALRGLHVLLVEKDDLGSGTSSRSSRLIHGGLRYLAHLDFRLVREDLGERELLLRNAPHLVKPLPFLIPIYGRGIWGRLQLGAGLILYDLMARGSRLPKHRWLSRKQVAEAEPALDTRGLQGAFLYYDAQAPLAERLCIENALDAEQHGATVLSYVRVVEITRHEGRVSGLDVEDGLAGERYHLKARMVVNAAGAELDDVNALSNRSIPRRIRQTRGTHVVAPPFLSVPWCCLPAPMDACSSSCPGLVTR